MQSSIERQVMASVGVIWGARLLAGRTALEVYALAASAVALWQLTWVHRVFENWAHVGLAGTWEFVSYAVLHTHLPVQAALLVASLAALGLLRDASRSFLQPRILYSPR